VALDLPAEDVCGEGSELSGASVLQLSGGSVDAGSSCTFPVTVQLASRDDRVRPGMAAEVTFRLASSDALANRIFVPAVAVGEDRDGRFVFLAEPEEQGKAVVRRKPVTVGDLTTDGEHDLIEVLDGLGEGDIIITAGVRRLEDGRLVRLPEVPAE
jgi:hypothetical protein